MRVSVVLCTHTLDRYDDCAEAANSVLDQTYDDVELVLVSDGSADVCERFRSDFGARDDVVVHCKDENSGLLDSRNEGARVATGDVVAFIDDDAVADETWVEKLVDAYETYDVPAAGGRMTPSWVAGKPSFLPMEFYFLVGVTNRGFGPDGDPAKAGEVRNTFGSNVSFKLDIFLDLGGFDAAIGGRQGDANLQGGETELSARLQAEYGHGVYYVPEATVAHKVFDYRTDPWWLLDRAFWQGYSKRAMQVLVPGSGDEETAFLGRLLTEWIPGRLKALATGPSLAKATQLTMVFALTLSVGLGYAYGACRYNRFRTGPGQ